MIMTNSKVKLPKELLEKTEWVLAGPMGPSVPRQFLGLPVMGIDGGARFVEHMDVWIGDGDSGGDGNKAALSLIFPSDKAASDLALALSLFTTPGPLRLHLWGLLGGRQDHQLFNLGEALTHLVTKIHSEINFYAHGPAPLFRLFSPGEWEIPWQGVFSLGSVIPGEISLRGDCKYQVWPPQILSPLSSLGLSNEADGIIRLKNQIPVFLCFPEVP
jgi:thiamine pyrophosphokinase